MMCVVWSCVICWMCDNDIYWMARSAGRMLCRIIVTEWKEWYHVVQQLQMNVVNAKPQKSNNATIKAMKSYCIASQNQQNPNHSKNVDDVHIFWIQIDRGTWLDYLYSFSTYIFRNQSRMNPTECRMKCSAESEWKSKSNRTQSNEFAILPQRNLELSIQPSLIFVSCTCWYSSLFLLATTMHSTKFKFYFSNVFMFTPNIFLHRIQHHLYHHIRHFYHHGHKHVFCVWNFTTMSNLV